MQDYKPNLELSIKYVTCLCNTLLHSYFYLKRCHPLMMYILLLVSSPGATGSYLPLLRFKPTKVRVLPRSALAKHAVLSYG